jgi:hypothetical protein
MVDRALSRDSLRYVFEGVEETGMRNSISLVSPLSFNLECIFWTMLISKNAGSRPRTSSEHANKSVVDYLVPESQ